MARKRDPLWEGKVFEEYAWPTVRRNFPLYEGWERIEQPTLPSRLRPDNLLWNEETEEAIVVEMKDRKELKESDIEKVRAYMDEFAEMVETRSVGGFVPIAWDTEVSRRVRRIAKKHGVTIRRLGWRK